jgi:uncharacterized protein YjbI with pentapeptide repeats
MWQGLVLLSLGITLVGCGGDDAETPSVKEVRAKVQPSAQSAGNMKKFQKTCLCADCQLSGVDMSNFRPAEDKRFAPHTIGTHYLTTICDLSRSDLSGAMLKNVNFSARTPNYCTVPEGVGCDSYVVQSKAIGANFKGADLSHSFLINVTFNQADFSGANLSHSEITQSHFANAKLIGADLSYVVANKDEVLGLQADMRQANFNKANLSHARLTAMFTGANFRGANLEAAYINTDESRSAGLLPWQGVNFIFANLKGAMVGLERKQGKHVVGIADVVIKNALLCRTIMPDGREENRDCRKRPADAQPKPTEARPPA